MIDRFYRLTLLGSLLGIGGACSSHRASSPPAFAAVSRTVDETCARPASAPTLALDVCDADAVARAAVASALSAPWLGTFASQNGRVPRLGIVPVQNRSDVHLDMTLIQRLLERAWAQAGRVEVVADTERELSSRAARSGPPDCRCQSADSPADSPSPDLWVRVEVGSRLSGTEGDRRTTYVVTTEIVDRVTKRVAWVGVHEMVKQAVQPRTSW